MIFCKWPWIFWLIYVAVVLRFTRYVHRNVKAATHPTSDQTDKQTPKPQPDSLRLLYAEICKSHHGIADFRAKLLALLPIASGGGIFLLLTTQNGPINPTHFFPIGLFGALVTLGLFFYEIRGIQHCNDLVRRGQALEEALHLKQGQFKDRPKPKPWRIVGATGAACLIYPTIIGGWIYIALVELCR